MDNRTRENWDDLRSEDRQVQTRAFFYILEVTDNYVDWAYEVWDELVATLRHKDNHRRSVAAQILCNLAKSDPQNKMLEDFEALFAVTKDEKFVTARHCLQSIWKVGAAGTQQQRQVIDSLARRFRECATEKNYTLIRYDIIQGLRRLYDTVDDAVKSEDIRAKALELIETEEDLKYRKKYATLWRADRRA